MVGLDVGSATTRVVRLVFAGDAIAIAAADLFPGHAMPNLDREEVLAEPLLLPKPLRAPYAALAVTSPRGSIRLLSIPAGEDNLAHANFNELLGLSEGVQYRIGYEVLAADGREQSILASALPENQARWAVSLLPQGIPAPCSLQTGSAAMLNCFARELAAHHGDVPAIFIQVGVDSTDVAAFYKGRLMLYRQCLIGSHSIIDAVHKQFGIEEELVPGILDDNLIDVSQTFHETIEPLRRLLVLAREFVERKHSCRIEKVLICGALQGAKHWSAQITRETGIAPLAWNPLATFPCLPDALSERVKGVENRFATAVGAALAVLEMERDLPR